MNKPVNIVFNADNNYAPYLIILIERILSLRRAAYPIDFYILDAGIKSDYKNYILDEIVGCYGNVNVNILFIEIDPIDYANLPRTVEYISLATYARLKIADYLKDISRAIYLDIDIVVNSDIIELWEQNLDGHVAGACYDPFIEIFNSEYKEKIGLSSENKYFNAGVMLFNLDRCREINLFKQCLEWTEEYYGKFDLQDQDMLNGVLKSQVKYLNSRFNFTINHRSLIKEKTDNINIIPHLPICIYHHVGGGKPWSKNNSLNGSRIFYKTYLKLKSRGFSFHIDPPSLKIRIKRITKEMKDKIFYNIY